MTTGMLMCTMARPSKLSRWRSRDWGGMIRRNSWLFFEFDLCKSRQIITGIGIKDLDLRGGSLAVAWSHGSCKTMGAEQLGLERIEKRRYTITIGVGLKVLWRRIYGVKGQVLRKHNKIHSWQFLWSSCVTSWPPHKRRGIQGDGNENHNRGSVHISLQLEEDLE